MGVLCSKLWEQVAGLQASRPASSDPRRPLPPPAAACRRWGPPPIWRPDRIVICTGDAPTPIALTLGAEEVDERTPNPRNRPLQAVGLAAAAHGCQHPECRAGRVGGYRWTEQGAVAECCAHALAQAVAGGATQHEERR